MIGGVKLKLLVVEDDEEDVLLLREHLEDALGDDFEISHAATPARARELLGQRGFDLCLLDHMLGPSTGLELLDDIRRLTEDLPVIFLTGQGDEETATAALKAGARDYLRKSSLTPESLLRSLTRVVQIQQAKAERRRAQHDLVREKEFIAAILEHSYDGIAVFAPIGEILRYTPGMERLFGYTAGEAGDFANLGLLIQPCEDNGEPAANRWSGLLSAPGQGEQVFLFQHKDGSQRWSRLRASSMPREGVVINGLDITESVLARQRIQHMALHDGLTGLPGRSLFQDRLDQAMRLARRNQTQVAVLYVDLDRFKPINDTYGHDAGDLVLRETARRIESCLRGSDTVARMGGDEFGVVLQEILRADDAAAIGEKIVDALCRPIPDGEKSYEVGASVGASLYPVDGEDMESLLRDADRAMYRSKRAGGCSCTLASP